MSWDVCTVCYLPQGVCKDQCMDEPCQNWQVSLRLISEKLTGKRLPLYLLILFSPSLMT